MSKVNFNPQGTLIQNEVLQVPPMSHITGIEFALSHDVFSSVDFSITYNGNTLEPQVDYILTQPYERARQEMGLTVYQRVKFLPAAPLGFASTVYVTYRAVGDFMDADDFLSVSDSDDRYCKRSNNLSDVNANDAILNLLEAASAVEDNSVRDNTSIPCSIGGKVSLLQIFNNWLKSKFQDWLGIIVTESDGSITGRSFSGEAATVASITRVTEGVHQVDTNKLVQTNVTYTVTFSIPTNKVFIGYRFDVNDLAGSTLNIESSYKVTRNQIIVSVKYDFQYGGRYPTIATVAMFCGQF